MTFRNGFLKQHDKKNFKRVNKENILMLLDNQITSYII